MTMTMTMTMMMTDNDDDHGWWMDDDDDDLTRYATNTMWWEIYIHGCYSLVRDVASERPGGAAPPGNWPAPPGNVAFPGCFPCILLSLVSFLLAGLLLQDMAWYLSRE